MSLVPKLADLSAANRRALSTDVARALEHLHVNDVVHGALTSRCIELRPMDLPGGVTYGACVLDWGLGDVKIVTERDEECKWMPAEQVETGEPSKAADVWALGCVIRCALYGASAPWDGFAPVDAAELIRTGASPRPPKLDGVDVPAPIRTATQQCWARDPDARKAAADIYQLLNDWIDGAADGAADAGAAATVAAVASAAALTKETFTPAPAKVGGPGPVKVAVGGEVFTPAPIRDEGPTPWLGKLWHYPDITRPQAEALLKTQPGGSFVVRSSSQPGINALTFIQDNGTIGHGLLYKENGTWSVEKKAPFHATLEVLLRTHTGLVYDAAQQTVQLQKYNEMFPKTAATTATATQPPPAQLPPAPVSADGAPSAAEGIVVCGRCEAIPAEVDCAQCAMLFCRGCSADLHGKGLFRMHALKPHANTLTPGTAAVVVAPPPRQRPSENDYLTKSWYRADWDRPTAEQVLGAMQAGAFGLRPSSQANRLALSHSKGGGAVGHAIIHIHNGENNRYGYSIEDREVTYPTIEQLLSGLSDLRFDLVPPPPAPAGGGSGKRAASPPPAGKLPAQAFQQTQAQQQRAVLTGSTEFSAFLPRAVRKDESGRFEAPKYSALGQSQAQPQTASALSTEMTVGDDDDDDGGVRRSPEAADAVLPPDDALEEEDGYQALPSEAAVGAYLPPAPPAAGTGFDDGEYGVMPAAGYGTAPGGARPFSERSEEDRFSEATEYAQIELPDGPTRHESRQSVRLSLSSMAQLVGDEFGLDDPTLPVRAPPTAPTTRAAVAPVPVSPVPASPAGAAGKSSKLCEACGKERAAKRVTMSDGTKVKLCLTCTEGIRVGSMVLTRDELTGSLVLSEPPSPVMSVVTGPGLTQTVVDRPTQVLIVAHTADGARCEVGGALVSATLAEPDGNQRPLRVIDRGDGSYVIGFVCLAQGAHALHVGMQRTPTAAMQAVGKSPYAVSAQQPTSASAGACVDCRRNPATAVYRLAGVTSFVCAACTSVRERNQPGAAQITLLGPMHTSPRGNAATTPSPPAVASAITTNKSSPGLKK